MDTVAPAIPAPVVRSVTCPLSENVVGVNEDGDVGLLPPQATVATATANARAVKVRTSTHHCFVRPSDALGERAHDGPEPWECQTGRGAQTGLEGARSPTRVPPVVSGIATASMRSAGSASQHGWLQLVWETDRPRAGNARSATARTW
jgi:hypothetical protein